MLDPSSPVPVELSVVAHIGKTARPFVGLMSGSKMQPPAGGVAKDHLAIAAPVQTDHSSSHRIVCGGCPISQLKGTAIGFGGNEVDVMS